MLWSNVYHNDVFAWLGGIQYGHKLREAVPGLVSFSAHNFCRHLDRNAAQLVLDIVLCKHKRSYLYGAEIVLLHGFDYTGDIFTV